MPDGRSRRARRQVDLIVCFDTSKSPIRNIQRMGRTGRTRPGRVVYILASGKEADDYQSNLMARITWPLLLCQTPHIDISLHLSVAEHRRLLLAAAAAGTAEAG